MVLKCMDTVGKSMCLRIQRAMGCYVGSWSLRHKNIREVSGLGRYPNDVLQSRDTPMKVVHITLAGTIGNLVCRFFRGHVFQGGISSSGVLRTRLKICKQPLLPRVDPGLERT